MAAASSCHNWRVPVAEKKRVMDIASEVADEWVKAIEDYLVEEWGMSKGEEGKIKAEWRKVWQETIDDPMGRMQLLEMMDMAGITPEERAAFGTAMLEE